MSDGRPKGDSVRTTDLLVPVAGVDSNSKYQPVSVGTDGKLIVTVSGSGSTDLGKAEDSAHASGDVGVMMLGVKNLSLIGFDSSNLDYTPVSIDTSGQIMSTFMQNVARTDGATIGAAVPFSVNNNSFFVGVAGFLYNGASWDRPRGNEVVTVLASAVRTSTTNSGELTNYNGRGVSVQLLVTATSGSPSLVVKIQTTDVTGGTMSTVLTSATLTPSGTATHRFVVYPGAGAVANEVASLPVGRFWRVSVEHGTADSVTYSVRSTVIV